MNGAGIYPIRACREDDALCLSTAHSIDEHRARGSPNEEGRWFGYRARIGTDLPREREGRIERAVKLNRIIVRRRIMNAREQLPVRLDLVEDLLHRVRVPVRIILIEREGEAILLSCLKTIQL